MGLAIKSFVRFALPFAHRARHSTTLGDSDSAHDDLYGLTRGRTYLHRVVGGMPPALREPLAEAWLRRGDAPGPAAEHVIQYLLSEASTKAKHGAPQLATVAKGANNFYRRQYRQYLNPAMGAFAMTATMAALGAGAAPHGHLWGRGRRVAMAMAQTCAGAPPILVLDHQTVATPLYLPQPQSERERSALARWLAGRGSPPISCERLMRGDEIRCAERGARAMLCKANGSMLELAGNAIKGRKLAILALHPHDPDAMGLHITLFGVEALEPESIERDYGLDARAIDPSRRAAAQTSAMLVFLVGGVEEAFTQCSQNLFVKRPRDDLAATGRAPWPHAWSPDLSLDRLISKQFEIFQGTVSASGLPGVSPRNGDLGKAAFVARKGHKAFVLVPYFVGNAVHGHAAKLWSNPSSTLLIWDDHTARCAVTISGPARIVSHESVVTRFPDISETIGARHRRNGSAAESPEYWFELEVAEIRLQDEPVAPNWLDPARSTCSIHAGGLAQHGKKPAYFAAESLPLYDMAWQHEREADGRPVDPTGVARRYWEWEAAPALAARMAHLAQLVRD